MCQYQASRLMRIEPLLAQLGINLIAIGNGTARFGKSYKETIPWRGEVLIDLQSQTHKTLKTKKWGLGVISSFIKDGGMGELYKKYRSQYKDHTNTSGSNANGLITGAVLAVQPGDDGEVVYSFMEGKHRHSEWADEHAILRAFGYTGELPELPEVQRTEDGHGDATPAIVIPSQTMAAGERKTTEASEAPVTQHSTGTPSSEVKAEEIASETVVAEARDATAEAKE